MRDRTKEYYGNTDKERNKERSRRWRSLNKGRVNAQIAKRRATALQATPPWAEFEQIAMLYVKARRLTETTGVDHEVDHIVPLKNDVVCGLHCLSNLRILTADANNRKKCKLIGVV
jgi:5-methylcytosine-specific restriction endonuclease McrA